MGDEENASYAKIVESQDLLHEGRKELKRRLQEEERGGSGSGSLLDSTGSRRIIGLDQLKQDERGMIMSQTYLEMEDNANTLEKEVEQGGWRSQNCLAIKLQQKID